MSRRFYAAFSVGLMGVLLLTMAAPSFAQDPAVPDAYRSTYDALAREYQDFNTAYAADLQAPSTSNPAFGGELLPASGNRGEALLDPLSFTVSVAYMEAMQSLGAGGVSLQISYPMLMPDFPRHDEYLRFFQDIVAAAHERGLKVLVESSPFFPDPQFSNVVYDYSGLSLADYFAGRVQMLDIIAREIAPDYLSIGHEPNTEMLLTGLRFSPDDYLAFVDNALASIQAPEGTMLGVGADVWEMPRYMDGYLARQGLDFINFHLYPLANGSGRSFLAELLSQGRRVRAAGKAVIVGETWLYKLNPADFASQSGNYQAIFALDVFDFWQPLDSQHIETIAAIARAGDFEYVSFFWTTYFFAYASYADAANLGAVARYQAVNRDVLSALREGTFSPTGETFRRVQSGS